MTTPWDSFIGSIERRKQQLDDVLEAYRTFQDKLALLPADLAREAGILLATSKPSDHPRDEQNVGRDLAGKTSLECAQIILTQNSNEPMHYGTIAKEMLRRGYEGRKAGTVEEVELRTMQSLWGCLVDPMISRGMAKAITR